jgi:hypothetical protein
MGGGVSHFIFTSVILFAGAVACSPAHFVPPPDPAKNGPLVSGRVDITTQEDPRTYQTFRFKRISGELNIAIVVQVHGGQSEKLFLRLRKLCETLFSKFGITDETLGQLDRIRFNLILEKTPLLNAAAKNWINFLPRDQSLVTLKTLLRDQVALLEQNFETTADIDYPADPFLSLEKVVKSLPAEPTTAPTFFHLVYLRDQDLFWDEGTLDKQKTAFVDSLFSATRSNKFSTVSLLSFLGGPISNRLCKPQREALDVKLSPHFKTMPGITPLVAELCDIPSNSLNAVKEQWLDNQGKLLLRVPPIERTLRVVVGEGLDKIDLSPPNFKYVDGEVYISPKFEGKLIEVSYEAAK